MCPHSEDRAPILFAPDSGILAPSSYFVTLRYPLTKLQTLGEDVTTFLSLSDLLLWTTWHSLLCLSVWLESLLRPVGSHQVAHERACFSELLILLIPQGYPDSCPWLRHDHGPRLRYSLGGGRRHSQSGVLEGGAEHRFRCRETEDWNVTVGVCGSMWVSVESP